MTTEWPFAERYKEYMMPPTQVREALKRLAKKNVDPATDTEENLHVIKAVHQAYANKKERARAASAKSRASKRVDDCGDIEDAAVTCEAQAHVSVRMRCGCRLRGRGCARARSPRGGCSPYARCSKIKVCKTRG